MPRNTESLLKEISNMPDTEKLKIVDTILRQLDRPDPEIDRIWKVEAEKRWARYKRGETGTVSYNEVMKKYRPE